MSCRLSAGLRAGAGWNRVRPPETRQSQFICDGDFMTVPEDQIRQLHPLATYVGGKKVFSAPKRRHFLVMDSGDFVIRWHAAA